MKRFRSESRPILFIPAFSVASVFGLLNPETSRPRHDGRGSPGNSSWRTALRSAYRPPLFNDRPLIGPPA